MNWSDITANWSIWSERIRDRFPHLENGPLERSKHNRRAFEAYLARSHNLSLTEAREEIDDFLYIETLARELTQQPRYRTQ